MSDTLGLGGALQAAVNLTEYVLGTKTATSSSTNGTSKTSTSTNTQVSDEQNVSTAVDTSSTTNNNSITSVQNTVDPGVLAMLKSLASTAISNSTDPNQTTDLLSGILQKAGDAMTAVFGTQKQAGVYNSSAAAVENNDILSRASAEAASAILGYQTQEQGIADTALQQAAQDTAGVVTTNASQSTTNTQQLTNSDIVDSSATAVQANSSTATTSQTSSKSKSGLSVVCTWMHQHGMLSVSRYAVVSDSLWRMPQYQQNAYYASVGPLVRILEKDHTTVLARAIIEIFRARTEYVCAKRGLRYCKATWWGWLAKKLVFAYCTPLGTWMLIEKHWLGKVVKV